MNKNQNSKQIKFHFYYYTMYIINIDGINFIIFFQNPFKNRIKSFHPIGNTYKFGCSQLCEKFSRDGVVIVIPELHSNSQTVKHFAPNSFYYSFLTDRINNKLNTVSLYNKSLNSENLAYFNAN